MYITNSYKYRKDGFDYVGGIVPEDAEVLETLDILNAEEDMDLVRISDGEIIGSSLWLHNEDTQDNYKEEPHQERKRRERING